MNHEIDIEIPASCPKTTVCHGSTCAGQYNTANLNSYLATKNDGGGIAYAPMCAALSDDQGQPWEMLGDGEYHTYTIQWHTGDGACEPQRAR